MELLQLARDLEKTLYDYDLCKTQVVFRNGLREDIDIEELSSYISEQENHDNHLKVSEVILQTQAHFLKSGFEIVDTPGVGSVHEKNSEAAYDYAQKSDAVIFMLSVDSPINQIEISFLEKAKE
ncbi:MAG: hypothetical protein GX663_05920 [Clostridiales bacterium]|nr:hypothetical protein [Clostridiales bacterium]